MAKRSAAKSHHVGTIAQVMVVGVLLLAVVWQINGVKEETPADVDMPAPITVEQEPAEPYITTDDVNLRRGPGTDHEVITVVPLHAEVMVTGDGQNGFLPVEVNGASAWLAESYVVPEGSDLGGTTADVSVAVEPEPTEIAALPTEAPVVMAESSEPGVPETVVEEGLQTGQSVTAAGTDVRVPPVEEPVTAEVVEAEPDPEQAMPVAAQTYSDTNVEATLGLTGEGERWVDVNRTTGIVRLYEGDRVVAAFEALIGKDPSTDGYYSTATGTFRVHMKNRELTETPFAEGVYLTDFVGFDWERSNGFHSPTRDAQGDVIQTGGTATLGCVRLGEDEARLMFDFAFIGMRVEIHD